MLKDVLAKDTKRAPTEASIELRWMRGSHFSPELQNAGVPHPPPTPFSHRADV
jgi:hypothetical protein